MSKVHVVYSQTTQNYIVLQDDILRLQEWTDTWNLYFNASKCKVMHVGKKNPSCKYRMENSGENVYIVNCVEEKDFGVTFDSNLTFDAHIQNVINKANKVLGIIRRTFSYLDKEMFLNLYKGLIRPHLEYANSVWAPHLKRQSIALERVQRRAARLLPELKCISYDERLRCLNLFSLKYRRYRGDLIQTFKIVNHIDDLSTNDFYDFNISNSITRHADINFYINHCNTNTARFNFSNRTAHYWNALSINTKTALTLKHFKIHLDNDPKKYIECYDYDE